MERQMPKVGQLVLLTLLCVGPSPAIAQASASPATAQPKALDNYTIQRLIILNDRHEVLLERNAMGWMTPALRSTGRQSVKEALRELALSLGVETEQPQLAGLFTYAFDETPIDPAHANISFRTHYLARYKSGSLVQPGDGSKEYRWVATDKAPALISMESLRTETALILNYPKTLWGGSFLVTFVDGKLQGTRTIEPPYPLRTR
jgi:hypothetical protein